MLCNLKATGEDEKETRHKYIEFRAHQMGYIRSNNILIHIKKDLKVLQTFGPINST